MVLHAMKQDDRLGPYRLLRRLGEGGMGVVHLAVDPQGRQVAVKVLRAEVAGDDVARRRLSREVETMRRVRSEYIAEVLDADVTGHRPYIVTRYIAGPPLDEVVKQDGPMELPALLKIAKGVASALAAVHSVGVIHRDLKPGNVLILDGQPVLIDFGIAQAVDATRLTQTGMFIGTPGYLAPEIIEGHEAGPEVDVHAWAGTLVFAATGQPPFGKGTLEMIFYNITAGKANVDAVPRELQPVLRAALQRDPAKRPKAAELAAQVERLSPGTGRAKMPDEISTLPQLDDSSPDAGGAPGRPAGQGGRTGRGGPDAPVQADPGDVPTPVASRPSVPSPTPWPPAPVAQPREYVSLLGQEAPDQGAAPRVTPEEASDPAATRRVTPEELRQLAAAQQNVYDMPTGMLSPEDIPTRGPAVRNQPRPGGNPANPINPANPDAADRQGATKPVPDGDIPTQRVRPQDLQEYIRNHPPQPGYPGQPNTPAANAPASPPPPYPQRQVSFEQTPHVRPPAQASPPPYPYSQPQQPQQPQQQSPSQGAFHPGQRPGHTLQRSKAYGVASALMLVVMAVAAVMAPVIVAVVVIPVAILLRAADIAQPKLSARRAAGAAAADVLRVIGQPAALLKSVGITVALVPYALILGLPVTLLLTVLVGTMPTPYTLSWGTAVALWTICAGPGVEGPSRQMRRTLASLLPSRSAAMIVAAVLGAVAALMVFLAIGTVDKNARPAVWTPVDVGTVVHELDGLRKKAA
ncbi:Serine/threonine protein kinase [Streptosporangium subroseum]|uniref:Serine/threonine protein kinase n=2 Tax=Streptosporangium subroseum TaxID=106412 RepID=A0A239HFL3_9ACTN|nr:Serine/threonine protein kinase [Streptosporangium subroseum]